MTAHRRRLPAVIPLAGWVERSPPDEGKAQVQLQGGPVQSKRLQRGKVAVKVPAVSLLPGATRLAQHRSTSLSVCDVIMFPLAFAFLHYVCRVQGQTDLVR